MEEQITTLQEIEEQETTQTEVITQEQTQTETTTALVTTSSFETVPEMRDNPVHDLYYYLGADLDYTPTNVYQAFTMGCRVFTASLLLIFFLIYLFRLMTMFFRSK